MDNPFGKFIDGKIKFNFKFVIYGSVPAHLLKMLILKSNKNISFSRLTTQEISSNP